MRARVVCERVFGVGGACVRMVWVCARAWCGWCVRACFCVWCVCVCGVCAYACARVCGVCVRARACLWCVRARVVCVRVWCVCARVCGVGDACVRACSVCVCVCVRARARAVPSKRLTVDFVLVLQRLFHAWKPLLENNFQKGISVGLLLTRALER